MEENFAVRGGIFVSDLNGFMKFSNSTFQRNRAISVIIGEVLDSVSYLEFETTVFDSNVILSVESLQLEVENCSILCHIPEQYRSFYLNEAISLHEINEI